MSEQAKHTPGPWFVAVPDGYVAAHGIEYEVTNHPRGWGIWIAHTQNKADARLIAAAPGLLAALEEMYEVYAGVGHEECIRARAAIDRALGITDGE